MAHDSTISLLDETDLMNVSDQVSRFISRAEIVNDDTCRSRCITHCQTSDSVRAYLVMLSTSMVTFQKASKNNV